MCGEALAQFVVTCVEECRAIGLPCDVQHGGTQDMPCGQKAQRVGAKIMRLAVVQCDDFPLQAKAGQHELMRQRGTNRELVPSDMVAVGVRNEGRIHSDMRVQPQPNIV